MSLTQQFTAAVNDALAAGKTDEAAIYTAFAQEQAASEESLALLQQMHETYSAAQRPTAFFNLPITRPDAYFEAFYALLADTFPPEERTTRESFLHGFARTQHATTPSGRVLIGRFWQTSGPQQYTPAGALQQFVYDPHVSAQHIVSLIAGSYLPLRTERALPGPCGIGAISYLATRALFRRGQGHGSTLVEAFENEVVQIAAARGHTVSLIFVEAGAGAPEFWYRCGYRWPQHVVYAQPPIDFDEQTGAPKFLEVPEVLMVKVLDGDGQMIENDLLIDVVKTVYHYWYLGFGNDFTPEAAERATNYVMQKVFQSFLDSLPQTRFSPLIQPPTA
jgi:ribosomal protein S18 acetylase RimI-like enzyme